VHALSRLLDRLGADSDTNSRGLAAILGAKLKWAGANQVRGVFSKADLIEAGGAELAEKVWRSIAPH